MEDAQPPKVDITASEYMLGGLAVELEHLAGMIQVTYLAQMRILSRLEGTSEEDLRIEYDSVYRDARHVARMAMWEGPRFQWPIWQSLPSDGARPASTL